MPRKKAATTPEAPDAILEGMENEDFTQNPEGALHMENENMNGLLTDGGMPEVDLQESAGEPGDDSANISVEEFLESDFADDTGYTGDNPDGYADAAVSDAGADDVLSMASAASENTESASGQAAPARRQRRQRAQAEPAAPVLTLEVGGEVETQRDKDNAIWHEIKNSQVSGTHLTGSLGKVERLESGGIIAIVDYKGQRIAIPLREMMISLNRPAGQSDEEYNERVSRVLNRMMGADIDFIVRGITGTGEERAAVASRKAAMLRLRRRYYLTNTTNGKPLVYPDRVVEARIIAVSQLAIRVEIFGVETSIRNRELSWGYMGDARDEFYVGDSVQVRVTGVEGTTPEDIRIRADIRSLSADNTREKLAALKPQTNCMGKVTDVRNGVIFISLIDGVRAISHKCFDHRKPGRGDDVLFVCTRIDEEGGVALGIVSRIVKRNI